MTRILRLTVALIAIAVYLEGPAHAGQRWIYKAGADDLTDEQYSFAAGYDFDYKYNNDFTATFSCNDGRVRFGVDVDTLVTSKSESFQIVFRVDRREPVQKTMKTYSNSNTGGYTYDQVEEIAKEILGGSKMFVRAVTWNNEYLEGNISLGGSDAAIQRVFTDCGVSLDAVDKPSSNAYSFADFQSDLAKLTPHKQQELLGELDQLMKKYR